MVGLDFFYHQDTKTQKMYEDIARTWDLLYSGGGRYTLGK
jgi:hypothetical protein